MSIVLKESTQRDDSGYTSSAVTVKVPDHDTDIMVKLPNGRYFELQWRVETQCVDVCMDNHTWVHNWSDNMAAAKPVGRVRNEGGHIRDAVQLLLDMGVPEKKPKPERHLKALIGELAFMDKATKGLGKKRKRN